MKVYIYTHTHTHNPFSFALPRFPLLTSLLTLHDDAPAFGFGAVFRRRLGGRAGDVFDYFVEEFARHGGAFGVAVEAEGLRGFEALGCGWMVVC